MSFYPTGYAPKEPNSDYMKLTEGDHRVRILAEPIIGFETWYEEAGQRKVKRYPTFEKAVADPNADQIKEFNAFVVWDYAEEMVRLLNVTQKAIQKGIYNLTQEEDWGDPREYDIVIKRKGKTLNDTEYSVMPKPHKPTTDEIKEAFKQVRIVSSEYFSGGHPIERLNDEKDTSDVVTSNKVDPDDIPFS